ncbi:gamma carbonic anhydrase family protein [Homoserinimonas sp. OAct 916]|uniref:gamma carbonic anhydrase family protein n=1 Tax=Homoserinimonas sp. OAct 916 TaxID=2211450 RepID=UPI000DBE32AB|nr:gamma carbonic anhydrase family protein [Homoserinimonas sp. OAct 916]
MTSHLDARILSLETIPTPTIAQDAWVAPGAVVVGNVHLAAGASVWYNAVLRSDYPEPITIGEGSNLQDNVSCHVDSEFPLTLGRGISVGHGAVLHGCTVEDDVLIGMSATVLNGAVIGAGSLIAAGAVVLEGTQVPPRSLVAGVPGRVRRDVTDEELEHIRANAAGYLRLTALHRSNTQ